MSSVVAASVAGSVASPPNSVVFGSVVASPPNSVVFGSVAGSVASPPNSVVFGSVAVVSVPSVTVSSISTCGVRMSTSSPPESYAGIMS